VNAFAVQDEILITGTPKAAAESQYSESLEGTGIDTVLHDGGFGEFIIRDGDDAATEEEKRAWFLALAGTCLIGYSLFTLVSDMLL